MTLKEILDTLALAHGTAGADGAPAALDPARRRRRVDAASRAVTGRPPRRLARERAHVDAPDVLRRLARRCASSGCRRRRSRRRSPARSNGSASKRLCPKLRTRRPSSSRRSPKSDPRSRGGSRTAGPSSSRRATAPAGPPAARREAIERHRPRALFGAGVGGALTPGLAVGDLVVSARVLDPEGEAPPPSRRLLEAVLAATGARAGTLLTVERPVVSAAEKAELACATGAPAVCDMESAAWARAAAAAGFPTSSFAPSATRPTRTCRDILRGA